MMKIPVSMRVFQYLTGYIREHSLEAGALLPGELELCAKLSVSRASVREAIAFLKTFGVCRSQTSKGLILTADRRQLDLLKLFCREEMEAEDFIHLKQLRDFLELGSCHLMVRNVTAKELGQLQTLVKLAAKNRIDAVDFEVEFHLILADLSNNEFVGALSLLYRPLFEYHVKHHPLLFEKGPIPQYIVEAHRNIHDALEAGDCDRLYRELRHQASHLE